MEIPTLDPRETLTLSPILHSDPHPDGFTQLVAWHRAGSAEAMKQYVCALPRRSVVELHAQLLRRLIEWGANDLVQGVEEATPTYDSVFSERFGRARVADAFPSPDYDYLGALPTHNPQPLRPLTDPALRPKLPTRVPGEQLPGGPEGEMHIPIQTDAAGLATIERIAQTLGKPVRCVCGEVYRHLNTSSCRYQEPDTTGWTDEQILAHAAEQHLNVTDEAVYIQGRRERTAYLLAMHEKQGVVVRTHRELDHLFGPETPPSGLEPGKCKAWYHIGENPYPCTLEQHQPLFIHHNPEVGWWFTGGGRAEGLADLLDLMESKHGPAASMGLEMINGPLLPEPDAERVAQVEEDAAELASVRADEAAELEAQRIEDAQADALDRWADGQHEEPVQTGADEVVYADESEEGRG